LSLDDPQGLILTKRKDLRDPEGDAQYQRTPPNISVSHG
jgi:hypothetical protein